MIMAEPLTASVRRRLQELAEEGSLPQHKIAEELGMTQSNVSKTINHESRPITLEFLEAAALVTHISAAELVAQSGSLYELNADEAAIVRALRKWPTAVRHALSVFLRFFADEEPVAGQTRNMHELWRHLDQKKRDAVYGMAVSLQEGMIPPDIAAGLFAQLSDDAKAALEKHQRTKRRRRANDA